MAADMALSNISTMTGEFSRAVLILILQFLKVAYFCSPDPFAAMFSLSSLFLSFKRACVTSWHFMIGWSRRWIISSFSYEALSIWDALVMSHLTTVSAMGELSLVPRTISLASPSFVVTLRNGDMPISFANSSGALSTFADLFTLYWACPNSCFSFISKENLSSNGIWLSYRGRETEFGCHTAGVFDVFDVFLARYLATCLQSMLLPWTKADWMSLICLQSIRLLLSTLLGFLMTLGCVLNVLASVRFLQECRFTSIRLHAWILMILARSRVSSA